MPAPGLFTIDDAALRERAASIRAAGVKAGAAIIGATTGTMSAAYGEELAKTNGDAQQQRIIAGGASSYGAGYGITMKAATSTAPLSGGLVPAVSGRAFEFGKLEARTRTFTQRSRKGNRYSVTRVTTNQLPSRSTRGWVAYPAASAVFPRVLEMWLQILVKFAHDGVEGK